MRRDDGAHLRRRTSYVSGEQARRLLLMDFEFNNDRLECAGYWSVDALHDNTVYKAEHATHNPL